MNSDPALRISLAADYAKLSNGEKLYKSQLPGLEKMNLVKIKQQEEAEFLQWAGKQSAETREQYIKIYEDLRLKYEVIEKVEGPYFYNFFSIQFLPVGNFTIKAGQLEEALSKDAAADAKQKALDDINKASEEYFSELKPETQKRILLAILQLYYKEQPGGSLPGPIQDILARYKGNTPEEKFTAFTEVAFSKSILTSKQRFDAFTAKPSLKVLKSDPLYNYYKGMYDEGAAYRQQYQATNRDIAKDMKSYVMAMMEKDPTRHFYPDANSTLRLNYGVVEDYNPRDGVHYDWMTTLSGIIEKEDSANTDYRVPEKMNELYRKRDFGKYSFNGDVPVCFITTNDITGGNSGSPVINANGEMTGLAFDGNYEGTAGDYEVDPELNRTICVDIRYVLFIMEKYAGAENLMRELKIVY